MTVAMSELFNALATTTLPRRINKRNGNAAEHHGEA